MPPPITTTRAWSTLMGRNDTSVAGRSAGVGEFAGGRDESPVVAPLMEVEPDDPERPRRSKLAVRPADHERTQFGAARAHDEFPDPARAVLVPCRVLWREPLVVVVVAVDDEVRAGRVQGTPERLDRAGIAVESGTESRVMPDRERAQRGRRLQICRQPSTLGRIAPAAIDVRTVGVENDDMPCA